MPEKVISIRIPASPDLHRKLDLLAKKRGKTMVAILRQLIEEAATAAGIQ